MTLRQTGRVTQFVRGGPRRQMVWARIFQSFSNSAGAVTDLLQTWRAELGIIKMLPGTTITRIVGTYDLCVVTADDAFTRWVWGLVVAPIENPPGVGNSPDGSPGLDWMFVRNESVVQIQDAGTPVVKRRAAHYDLDLRSQRKFGEIGETLFYVSDNPDGDNFDVQLQFNILLKLP